MIVKELRDIRVVLLAGPGDSTRAVANLLHSSVDLCGIILENPPSRARMLQRRAQKLGAIEVLGQLLFIALTKIASKLYRRKIADLYSELGFEIASYPEDLTHKVQSANSPRTHSLLSSLRPDVVVINGTRILSQKTLDSVDAPFINIHTGITPKYRGVHGGYWALALEDEANCGVTIHFVDKGIDTGDVLFQVRIQPTGEDNFLTYPVRQLGAAREPLLTAIRETANKTVATTPGVGPSQLFYHPTLWGYCQTYLRLGVR